MANLVYIEFDTAKRGLRMQLRGVHRASVPSPPPLAAALDPTEARHTDVTAAACAPFDPRDFNTPRSAKPLVPQQHRAPRPSGRRYHRDAVRRTNTKPASERARGAEKAPLKGTPRRENPPVGVGGNPDVSGRGGGAIFVCLKNTPLIDQEQLQPTPL